MEENIETAVTNINTVDMPIPKTPKNKGLIVTTIIACIFAIAGIGFGIFMFVSTGGFQDDIADTKTTEVSQNNNTGPGGGSLHEGQQEVKSLVKQIRDSLVENIGVYSFYTTFGEGSPIKIPNTEVYTSSDESYGVVSAADSNYNDTIMSTAHTYAESVLLEEGFTEDKGFIGGKTFYNPNMETYCYVSEDSVPFNMSCSRYTWISDADKDLALALANAIGEEDVYITFGEDSIQDSSVSPYQTLQGSTMGAAALFYRVSPDSDWQFFNYAQGMISCSEYNSQDLKNAFAGEICIDDSTGRDSIVEP